MSRSPRSFLDLFFNVSGLIALARLVILLIIFLSLVLAVGVLGFAMLRRDDFQYYVMDPLDTFWRLVQDIKEISSADSGQ